MITKESIKRILQDAAASRRTETYNSLLKQVNKGNRDQKLIHVLIDLLIDIGNDCYSNNEPPLNVLASQNGLSFNPKSYDWYVEKYLPNHKWKGPKRSYKDKFFEKEKIACFDFWRPKMKLFLKEG